MLLSSPLPEHSEPNDREHVYADSSPRISVNLWAGWSGNCVHIPPPLLRFLE